MKIVERLLYTKDHEWVQVNGDNAKIGITDYAQHAMGEIVYVELPAEDDTFEKGEAFGVIESVKAASDIFMPLSGVILKANEDLEDEPESLNSSPYHQWIIEMQLSDKQQLNELMTAIEYEKFCNNL